MALKFGRQKVITPYVGEILEQDHWKGEPLPEGRKVGHVLAERMIEMAIEGSATMMKYVVDRVDGAPVVIQDVSAKDLEEMTDDELDKIIRG